MFISNCSKRFLESGSDILFLTVSAGLWVVVGITIAFPYTILSSGSFFHFILTTIMAPVIIFFLIVIIGVINRRRDYHWVPLLFGAWAILPICFNFLSFLFKKIGHNNLSELFFTLRFPSLLIPPVMLVIVLILLIAMNKNKQIQVPEQK